MYNKRAYLSEGITDIRGSTVEILFILYVIAGYWAVGQTIFANKIRFGTWWSLIIQQLVLGMFLGIILIPIAVIKRIVFK